MFVRLLGPVLRPIVVQLDWEDRKGPFPTHDFFDGMCPDTFLIVSLIEFVCVFFLLLLLLCSFWGSLISGSRRAEAKVS